MTIAVLIASNAMALAQEPVAPLKIPPLPPADTAPTFHIKVEGGWASETPLQVIRRELAEESTGSHRIVPGGGTTPPLVAVDVLPAIMGAIKSVRAARYAHAVADARERVAEDLADFCSVNDCSPVAQSPEDGVIIGVGSQGAASRPSP
jgi:hypothetical protein